MRDSIGRRINAERFVLLGWSRAILLQLAHPLVAAGVADHSSFRGTPWSAASRLHHTVHAMLALTFDEGEGRRAALERIKAIHRRVHGQLAAPTGRFPGGTPYSAEDPDLLLWVHATLLDSIPLVYDSIVRPLTREDRDAYCEEAASVAIDLGARPAEVPRDWHALTTYLDRMYSSGSIVVGDQARELAAAVIAPSFAPMIAPVAWANRLVTIGLLPEQVRQQYGFGWSTRRAQVLRRLLTVLRWGRQISPPMVRVWKESRPTSRPD